ncbi:MAG: glycine--tRNA ligase subunit beta [Elusimicrobia bacterium GWA2_56_46]|nr:MAG: glycine--tRNA ligase subunit beta [Elusimicrobia bacterium GWA2_56_46]OGR55271.1 MAG: glycine--tRNA ligase subunit beta [Elusimicrobia bacterium GWC2_56_31]HBB66587.1 glycine--tRNA ligase subunit beta [Elusimicrobiota bacterium]HBW23518.1 glycine--tRNA ligase subunit beta [Elusimicrobiota bacterium]
MIKRDALLEIRIENIPARFVTSAEAQLEAGARGLLAAANLPFESLKAYGTYKRLVLHITGLPARTEEKTVKALGPLAKFWKDADGNFTPQSAGFAKGQGTTPDKLTVETAPKGEVLVSLRKIPGRPAVKALAEILPKLIGALQFPKTMVWEETRVRFARPVRSLAALYGDKVIPFSFAGIKTGRFTVGLSAKGSRKISISSAEKYFRVLENVNVLVKDEERARALAKEIEQVSRRTKLEVDADPELVGENLYLVEYPVCVVGTYDQEYLKLPAELVQLVMKKQLKFFTVRDGKKKLQPYFVGIRDGVSKGQKNVEEGFRNVLEARFRDAIFFYTRDLSDSPENMLNVLKTVTFQEKLGSMYDKTVRVERLAAGLAAGIPGLDAGAVKSAAHLVYSDLSSNVVREFTELQGVMGYYYARNAGLDEVVSRAVGEFYWPVGPKSPLPSSKEGAVVSMAGKLDTLASDFAAGQIPTGSEDPHALRRQTMGVVRLVLENELGINLKEAVRLALDQLPAAAARRDAAPVMEFIWQRAEAVFGDSGFRFDEVKAAREFFMRSGDLLDCRRRISDLHEVRKNPDFEALAMAFKRAKNILKQAKHVPGEGPDEAVFEKDEERSLYADIKALSGKLKGFLAERDYEKGLVELVSIKGNLDGFFDKVMVMVEDAKVKENRLRLIHSLVGLFEDVADLSQLQQ